MLETTLVGGVNDDLTMEGLRILYHRDRPSKKGVTDTVANGHPKKKKLLSFKNI